MFTYPLSFQNKLLKRKENLRKKTNAMKLWETAIVLIVITEAIRN